MKAKYVLQMAVVLFVLFVSAIASGADRDYWPTKKRRTSTPVKQSMDFKVLGKINSYVKDAFTNTKGVLVVRHGYLVFKENYRGDASDLVQLIPATKSVTSVFIGIALKEGYL
jgi:hypothetical protein